LFESAVLLSSLFELPALQSSLLFQQLGMRELGQWAMVSLGGQHCSCWWRKLGRLAVMGRNPVWWLRGHANRFRG
jgi:hypothetical protein